MGFQNAGRAALNSPGNGPLDAHSLAACCNLPNSPNQAPAQEDNRASEITCASMRADELRDCLVRAIARSMAIELQVQAALFDCDDALAIENLRRHWRVMRADVSPMAAELGSFLEESP